MTVVVGTAGYSYWDAPEDYEERYESKLHAFSERFPAVEVNRTFYSLPRVETVERWRREAAADFEFTVKAWQGMTHAYGSPTWNGRRDEIPDDRADEVGALQPTSFVEDAWNRTRERAEALDASVVLVQTPPSFGCTDEHERDARALFDGIERGDLTIAWEPRGDWAEHPERVADLCADCDLVHVVDPLRAEPVDDGDVAYLRLHGLNDDPYDYDYHYDAVEIDRIADAVAEIAADRERVYCVFNNYGMYDDALALLERLDDAR